MKKIDKFINDEYYHIYNRGADKREIFSRTTDYLRFLKSLKEFNTSTPAWKHDLIRGETSNDEPFVDIVAFCLNSNHFHLILKQRQEKGITKFMRKIGTGYTMYFNKKYDRSGVLFQGKFKAVHIDTDEYLLYVSAYVNCNCEVHGTGDAEKYKWCSFPEYLNYHQGITSGREIILGQFSSVGEYRDYAKIQAVEMRNKKEMQELTLE